MKQCSKCHEWKPETDFYKDKRSRDGMKCQCKKCHCKTTVLTRDEDKHRTAINKLRQVYNFLFMEHAAGFFRFALFMLLPSAFSTVVCRVWMWVLDFILILVIYAREYEWNKEMTK